MIFNNKQTESVNVVPNQKVFKLTGHDGNAIAIIGRAKEFNRKQKYYSKQDMDIIVNESMSGDYDHLLCVYMNFFNVN